MTRRVELIAVNILGQFVVVVGEGGSKYLFPFSYTFDFAYYIYIYIYNIQYIHTIYTVYITYAIHM